VEYGWLVFEDRRPGTPAEALAAPEEGLTEWLKEQSSDFD
jgi:hypothetical protein